MANKLISTMKMPDGTAYDIDAVYLGGYEADEFAKVEDLDSKADVYEHVKKLSDVKVGDNLSGITLVFDTSITYPTEGMGESGNYIEFGNHSYEQCKLGYASVNIEGYRAFMLYYFVSHMGFFDSISSDAIFYKGNGTGWVKSTYTFPTVSDNTWVVTNIGGSLSSDPVFSTTPLSETTIDCEYNYKNKADIYKVASRQPLEVGMDMGGKQLIINTDAEMETHFNPPNPAYFIRFSSGSYIYPSTSSTIGIVFLDMVNQQSVVLNSDFSKEGWIYTEYTLPQGVGTITEIASDTDGSEYTSVNDTFCTGTVVNADCESNYKAIQNLQTQIDEINNPIKKLSDIKVGDNLSGVTLVFDTNSPLDMTGCAGNSPNYTGNSIVFGNHGSRGPVIITVMTNSFVADDYASKNIFALFEYNSSPGFYNYDMAPETIFGVEGTGWINSSYTFPTVSDNTWTVTEIKGNLTANTNFKNTVVEGLNEAESGGVYRHHIELLITNFAVEFVVYNTSSQQLTTVNEIYAILGTLPIPVQFNGSDGAGSVSMNMNSSGTVYAEGAIVSGNNVVAVNYSGAISDITDTVTAM